MSGKEVFYQGNEACAEGALYAGCRFFGGYPITPSTEVAELLSRRLPKVGGAFIQMEDEIAAMASIIGASLVGKKSLTATSGPGMSLKLENLGFACITEVPCVILNVMRGGPSTGLPTGPSQSDVMQAKWGTHGDHPAIVLTPASVQEIFNETVRAFNISERLRTPVILLTDEIIGHMREKIVIPEKGELEIWDRPRPDCPPEEYLPYDTSKGIVPPMADFGSGYRFHVTGLNHDASGFPTNKPSLVEPEEERLMAKVTENLDMIEKYEYFQKDGAKVGVMAFGSSARSAKAAIKQAQEEGIPVDLLRPVTLWPYPEGPTIEMAGRVDTIVVPEMNLGQMINEVQRCIEGRAKVVGVNRVDGDPITPENILQKIREVV
ncbi:MAG: 2-oxoacid:acceptor oxidoreductase subunit alpha [bacterium]|nr:2-oxoacid:acceptor oxidoreductase subunit alpha [bacterium]MDT8366073.1 2-oxoacid:acceptor oxidoreductase subunit alpha [bacterium]